MPAVLPVVMAVTMPLPMPVLPGVVPFVAVITAFTLVGAVEAVNNASDNLIYSHLARMHVGHDRSNNAPRRQMPVGLRQQLQLRKSCRELMPCRADVWPRNLVWLRAQKLMKRDHCFDGGCIAVDDSVGPT